jgi:hypothetical protein
MRNPMLPLAAVLALAAPLARAADEAGPTPAAVPSAAAPAVPAPAPAAPPGAAPAAIPPVTAPAAPAPDLDSYAILKGGWFGSSGDFQGESFSGSGTWELAVGTGRVVGVELGVGSMTTKAGNLEVTTVPVLLSLRLQLPLGIVAPFATIGGGAYFNAVKLRNTSVNDLTAGWQGGVGCDVHLGRLLLGAEARYMGISPTIETIGTLTLDRYELMLRGGVLF